MICSECQATIIDKTKKKKKNGISKSEISELFKDH